MTYHLDNEDGLINLYRYDRTDHNHMAYIKGDSVGKLMAIIVNELDHLPKYESLSVTIEKPLSDIRDIEDAKNIFKPLTFAQYQALEECLLCDNPSMSAKSIARQWFKSLNEGKEYDTERIDTKGR